MAYIESTMLPLGTKAPDFKLPDTVSGRTLSLDDIKSDKATVIMFLCNHCPYVHHVNPEIVRLVADYKGKGVAFAGICSNDVENYPQDSPELMKEVAAKLGYDFPYLYDESQEVARNYDAACTPDFYVFDGDLHLVYRGRLDDSRLRNETPLSGSDLRAAIDAVLDHKPVSDIQYPSGGCGIKWKSH
jgi:thiol-disulfide isomerase/thioredoxin